MKAIEDLNGTTFMGVRISVEKGRVKNSGGGAGAGGGGGRGRGRGGGMGGGSGNVGPMYAGLGGRDRGGPYSRELVRPWMGGSGGGEYSYREPYEYGRAEMPRYDGGYGMDDRRPMYDDRHGGYMGDRDRPYPNGYGKLLDEITDRVKMFVFVRLCTDVT